MAVIGFNRPFQNFYHWMAQCLPAIDASVKRVGADLCILVLPSLTPWQEETLALLGLENIPRIDVGDRSHHYYFRRAYYSEYLNGHTSFFLSPRTLEVFDKIALRIDQPPDSPRLIYVARSDTSNRPVINEQEVQTLLAVRGFVSVVPGSLSIANQIRLFRGARIVIGAHGAGLTNIAFCRPGTQILELVQSVYANPCVNRIAQARGLDYHAECFLSAEGGDVHKQPWAINTDRLLAEVESLLTKLGPCA